MDVRNSGALRRYANSIAIINRLLDVTVCVISGVISYHLRFSFLGIQQLTAQYQVLIFIGLLLVALIFPVFGIYESWRVRGFFGPAARVVSAWCVVLLLIMALLVFFKQAEHFSRIWLASWAALTLILILGTKFLVYGIMGWLRRRGYNQRQVIIIGNDKQCRTLLREIGYAPWLGLEVVKTFRNSFDTKSTEYTKATEELRQFVEARPIDEVWISIPLDQTDRLRAVLDCLRDCPANIRYLPDFFGLFLLNHGVTEILGLPMLDLSTSPMQGGNGLIKGLEDRILSAIILTLVSPLMLGIALAIKITSSGPIFYVQERVGWNGRVLKMLKFRSMAVDSETETGAVWAQKNDPRTTKIGSFLRKTSLDELPQFINVLIGDMSIVGPRPERLVFVKKFQKEIPGYMQKHMVKAGITGWAQVNGWRGRSDLRKRIEHDLYYIEHWSLWFDLKIIFLTLYHGFVNENAY